jgi:hypothetical protein
MELRKIVGKMPKSEVPELPNDINWKNHNLNNTNEFFKNILLWLITLLLVVVSYISVKIMINY